jgi:hypothetical protein
VSGSTQEIQELADQILELLGVRMQAGQVVIHYADGGKVQKVEINTVHRPRPNEPCKRQRVDSGTDLSAR